MKKNLIILAAALLVLSCSSSSKKSVMSIKPRNHTFSNYDSITLKHIALDLKVDFQSKSLSGKAVLSIDNHTKAKRLVLDTRQMDIEKVLLEDDSATHFELGAEVEYLGKPLIINIKPDTRQVAVYYRTHPDAKALQWLTPEQTSGKKNPMLFTQSQAVLARTWVPCMDAPAIRFTYSAKVQCPANLMALMSAENALEKHSDGIYTFNMPQPIPSYLLALTVGDFEFRPLGKNCGVFAEPNMIEKSATEFTDLDKMITAASNMYGAYGWGRYDVVVMPPSFPFGGMENPRVTFATPTIIVGDKSLVALVAHELAHSWSGNLVTNRTWNDFWLNEGFTVYFEERIMEKLYGKDYVDMLSELSLGELKLTVDDLMQSHPDDTKLYLNLDGRDPDEGVSDIAYIKGCFFLRSIENQVGRAKWDAFLNAYFKNFSWKTVTTQDFIDFLEANLIAKNPGLKINYKEWIYEQGVPSNCPVIVSSELSKVREQVKTLVEKQDIKTLNTTGWTTHHWLYFLRNLPADTIKPLMGQLDTAFNLTASTNAEIQCDWYGLCIVNNYTVAYPAIDNFLCNVGRRKFVKPLFEKLVKTPEGKAFAKTVFAKAEKGYHAVTADTVREILAD